MTDKKVQIENEIAEAVASSGQSNADQGAAEPSVVDDKPKGLRDVLEANFSEDIKAIDEKKVKDASNKPVTKKPEQDDKAVTLEEKTAPAIVAPAEMTQAEKDAFNKLDSESKAFISRYVYGQRRSLTEKTQQLAEQSKQVQALAQAVPQEVADQYAREGISPSDIVRRSIAWDRAFRADPVAAARDYLDAYGIDPSELLEEPNHGTPQQQAQDLRQQGFSEADIDKIVNQRLNQAFAQREFISRTQTAQNDLESFMRDKPFSKDPATSQALRLKMAPLAETLERQFIERGQQPPYTQILEQAYNFVIQNDPEFKALSESLGAKTQIERTNAEAQRARQASRSISGGSGTGNPAREHRSIRESLEYHLNNG